MGEFLKYSKIWLFSNLAFKGVAVAALLIFALAFAFGDGGTFTISWVPGVGHE